MVGDSHARGISSLLVSQSGHSITSTGICKPNTVSHQHIGDILEYGGEDVDAMVFFGGANDAYRENIDYLKKNMRLALLQSLVKHILVVSVPFRRDIAMSNGINEAILDLNIFLNDLCNCNRRLHFVDISVHPERFLSGDGMHLNYTGKLHLSKIIVQKFEGLFGRIKTGQPLLNDSSSRLPSQCGIPAVGLSPFPLPLQQQQKQQLSLGQSRTHIIEGTSSNVYVCEDDMGRVIDCLKNDKSVAFSHCISDDFHMGAGVAVLFRKKFGRPVPADRLNNYLTYQNTYGAGVYGMITKDKYNTKPTPEQYNTAFNKLLEDFKKKEFTSLICSPMGCVRDRVLLDNFAFNIVQFQRRTGAIIFIITKDKGTSRKLGNGLSYQDFVRGLRCAIKKQESSKPLHVSGLDASASVQGNDVNPFTKCGVVCSSSSCSPDPSQLSCPVSDGSLSPVRDGSCNLVSTIQTVTTSTTSRLSVDTNIPTLLDMSLFPPLTTTESPRNNSYVNDSVFSETNGQSSVTLQTDKPTTTGESVNKAGCPSTNVYGNQFNHSKDDLPLNSLCNHQRPPI